MAGYIIGVLQGITDAAAFTAYQSAAGPTVAQYGGKLVLNSRKVEQGDGNWAPVGVVIVEFASAAQAKRWYNSPEYQAVIGQRFQSAESAVIIVDGD